MSARAYTFPETRSSPPIALAAATETRLVGADGIDVTDADRAEFGIDNTGGNSLTPAVYYQLTSGGKWFKDATSFSAIASGASGRIVLNPIQALRVRVTATSAAGSTCTV